MNQIKQEDYLEHPLVSIVTASYNQGKYIKDCIDSVRNQAYRPIEHIILDNRSTDETHEILREYKKNPNGIEVKIIIESDKGQSDAINKGFLKASGDIVTWLNTDEYYLPGALYKVIKFWEEKSDIDIIFGDCVFVDSNKNILRHKQELRFDYGMLLYYGCYIPSCSTFFKMSIIEEGLLLNSEYRNCMDFEYYVRLSKKGKRFKHIPEELACFRWHQNNISHVYAHRRRAERLKVQLEYGFRIGNREIRIFLLDVLKWFYIFKRNYLRIKRNCLYCRSK